MNLYPPVPDGRLRHGWANGDLEETESVVILTS